MLCATAQPGCDLPHRRSLEKKAFMKEKVNEEKAPKEKAPKEKATEETIKLDQFLKLAQVVESGGQAKHLIQTGMVFVNGVIEMRRGRKLRAGDVVVVEGEELVVETE